MKIRKIRTRALDLALERPVETASGTMRSAPVVLIDLLAGDGVEGHAYVRCYTPLALEPLARLIADAGSTLEGAAAAPFSVERRLQRAFRLVGPQGLTGMAMAGIDMALWDALARARGVPLVTLLGGEPRSVPAYASLRTMSPAGAAQEAGELVARGFRAIKMKLGGGTLADDLATIRAVRSACGQDVRLMVDYNQAFDPTEAIERARALDDEGICWIEEPVRADDCEGHARVAAAARAAIAVGENAWGLPDVARIIAARACDQLVLDVMKGGGVTGWMRAAALAEAAGLPVSSHTFPEFSAHLLAVTPTARYLEYLDHLGPILADPVRIENGCAVVADRPGSGVEWNEAAIAARA